MSFNGDRPSRRFPLPGVYHQLCPPLAVPKCPDVRQTSVAGISLAPFPPNDFNNLCGFSFGIRIANKHAKAQLSVLDVSGLGRVYVTDSRIRSQVGSALSRAAVRQGIHLRRLRALRLMVGT